MAAVEGPMSATALPTLKNLTSTGYGNLSQHQKKVMQDLVRPHIESFNFMLEDGLSLAIQCIPPIEFMTAAGQKVTLYFTDAMIGSPTISETNLHSSQMKVFPTECREGGLTYKGKLHVTVQWKIDNEVQGSCSKVIALVPMMVKCNNCSLSKLSPKELVRHNEEAEEAGGYFIINGIEKIIRMLILPRRNYPMAIVRPTWKNRGPLYTEYGIQMRSVRKDQTAVNMILHYLSDGSINMCFGFNKELFYIPIVFILKALLNTTDQHIYQELIKGEEENTFLKDCVATMLRTAQEEGATNQKTVLNYIGERFRVKIRLPEWYSDEAIAQYLLNQCVCIHLETSLDKFNMLTFMTRKLYALALGKCAAESADSPMMQEVLLGGHLYLMVLKERMEQWLQIVAQNLEKASKTKAKEFTLNSASVLQAFSHSSNISHQMEYLMATGNLVSRTGLALLQVSGFTVVADRLNMFRFISHFRCVHRGAFFSQMRTTSVRKLLPEAWGFLCPVHTPDGAPCGLLNHLAADCEIVNVLSTVVHLNRLLCSMGMYPYDTQVPGDPKDYYPVVMDGRVLGNVDKDMAQSLVNRLRIMKILGKERIPATLEICLIPKTKVASQFPALFLFTQPARMMRPVTHLQTGKVEMIGTFEQVYMDVAIVKEEIHERVTTHIENKQTAMLSAIASMTPFSDFNQSPRNMYQCQMGKQTMGTPVQALKHRTDNKLYRIQTPQSPLVRPASHDLYNMDEYPLGTNAIVAVISYTGYDMEDAMVLNKSSYERGFAHGSIYKAQFLNLEPKSRGGDQTSQQFGCLPDDKRSEGWLDPDGLPPIGAHLEKGDPFYSYIDSNTGQATVKKYQNMEPCIVDDVKIIGNEAGTKPLTKACVKMRIQRNPIIGDKFSSRHGQKGICSQKWPTENMPFSESGMTPDIIFNPHGFPSRMTIGMMIESMAGKSASLNGHVYDATPFEFSEDDSAIDYFGKLLVKSGYDYFGTERLYSGIDGREFEADIFMGVVYYQRLRHMVADKFQVRTTGPIDALTHQPVQGRKRQGGIRFGEMERDALLAHGTSFLLQDRLMNCSDRTMGHVCTKCGSLLSTMNEKPANPAAAAQGDRKWYCKSCDSSDHVELLAFPYVFRYLVAELAAMNIKTSLDLERIGHNTR